MKRSELIEQSEGSEIAVVGMACRLPKADGVEAFWRNVRDGVEAITYFTDEELETAGNDPAVYRQPGYVKAGFIVDGIDLFDAAFFGYSPREAELIDPQHRLFLECAWEALEDAGYDSDRLRGAMGVYAGAALSRYLFNILSQPAVVQSAGALQAFLGNDKDYLATRISYKLGLNGPSMTVQTACSTSLVAVHLACQALLGCECDAALAGGVSLAVPMQAGTTWQEGGIVSRDGRTRAFDAAAGGTLFGSGAGVVVLKRLADAVESGDCIRAVIRGTAINNDGSLKVGFTAPSVAGQAAVIREAFANADVHPETVGYIEAHGTGTALGDPVEISALSRAFRAKTDARGFCAVGSVKPNIGHLSAAAGVSSLIKAVLALEHQQIPPSLNFERPNPEIDFASSPFYVNTRLADWQRGATPRRAGVSSFGIGGTNAHAVLEEAPEIELPAAARPWQLLIVSARTPTALAILIERMAASFAERPDLEIADAAYTMQVGRRAFAHRRFAVVRDTAGAIAALRGADPDRSATGVRQGEGPPLHLLLPGTLDPRRRPGLDLYRGERVFRESAGRACELLSRRLGIDLRETLFGAGLNPAGDPLSALAGATAFVVGYALAELLRSWGARPSAAHGAGATAPLAGHLTGSLSLEDAALQAAAVLESASEGIHAPAPQADAGAIVLDLGHTLAADGGDPLPSLLAALGSLWINGVTIDWESFNAGERRQRTRLPTYPFERQRFWIERAKREAAAAGGTLTKEPRLERWFYLPVWKGAPLAPSYHRQEAGRPGCWLVWADAGGVGESLATRLRERGNTVRLVVPGALQGWMEEGTCTIRPGIPDDYESLFRDLERRGEIPSRIVHLWTVDACGGGDTDPASLERLETLGFRSLLSLVQALSRHGATDRVEIAMVSSGLHDITGGEARQPVKATLLGLAQVVGQELTHILCRSIELEAAPADATARERAVGELISELDAAGTEPVVAWRGGHRWAQGYDSVTLPVRPEGATAFRTRGVYLLTGGLGHIGSTLSEHLARHYQARLVLVGRSGLPPQDGWDEWLESHPDSDPTSRRIRRVRSLEQMGAEVLVATADVADAARMKEVAGLACERFGTLHGVIHAAGWIGAGAFNAVQDMREELVDVHFGPKVLGAVALAQALEGMPLDFCVFTSSLSAILGGLGHGAYSAANRFLDAFAHRQSRRTGVRWLSINWDTWVDDEQTEAQTACGLTLAALNMTFAEGVETLERALLLPGEPQIVVSTGDLQARLDQGVRIDPTRAQPDAPAACYARPLLDVPYIAPETDLEQRVAGIWQEVLGLEQVGIHDNFFDLGGHSLLATQLFFLLRKAFRTELPLKVLFEAPTVAEMSRVITASLEPGGGKAAIAEMAEIDWSRETELDPAIVPARPAAGGVERLFLTGGTGFLGAFLLTELLRSTEAELHCLVRAADATQGLWRLRDNLEAYGLWEDAWAERVVAVPGNLAAPQLGLPDAEFSALAGRIDAVYHSGAVVNFLYPYSQSRPANVLGTQELLRLAAAGRAKPFHQVSTTGVIAARYRAQGSVILEDQPLEHPEELTLGYTQSKWVSECLVRAAAERGLCTAIYRPGSISGHSVTGACQTNDFYWLLIKACIQIGGYPDGNLSLPLTPVDYVSSSIVEISRGRGWEGKAFHLVSKAPLTLRDLIAWMESFGYSLECLSYAGWRERLLQGMERTGGNAHALLSLFPESAQNRSVGGGVSSAALDTSNTLSSLAGSGITCPSVDGALLERYFTYFIRTKFLAPPGAGMEKPEFQ